MSKVRTVGPVQCLCWCVLAGGVGISCTRVINPNAHTAVVLMASDRRPVDVRKPLELVVGVERGQGLTFQRCVLSLPEVQRPDHSHPEMLLREGRQRIRAVPELIWQDAFQANLAEAGPEPGSVRDVLVYVHGYAEQPLDAVIDAAQFAHDVQFNSDVVAFSWPTRGLYLSYFVDGINAEWSVPDFVRLLELVHKASGMRRIHIVGHSMGARIVVRGVKDFLARRCLPSDTYGDIPEIPAPPNGRWFGQIVLVAPDEDTEVFERSFAPILARAADRTTIYFSTRDRALDLANIIFGYKRLGMGDCPHIEASMLESVESINTTQVDRGLLGHFYHLNSPEVLHDIRCVLAGREAERQLERKSFFELQAESGGRGG